MRNKNISKVVLFVFSTREGHILSADALIHVALQSACQIESFNREKNTESVLLLSSFFHKHAGQIIFVADYRAEYRACSLYLDLETDGNLHS